MKVLLCGGSGLVGRVILNVFNNEYKDHTIIGTYNNNYYDNLIKIDFLNINNLEEKIKEINPDICISNIAERQNEKCENRWNEIKKINIDIPYNLAVVCKKFDIFLVHISTDYVYDGQVTPFSPDSLTNPLQNYGISKLIAEKRIISVFNNKNNYLILRVPVLYSDQLKTLEESAVPLIIKKVMNKVEIFKEDNFSIRRPVYIEDFARFIIDTILKKNLSGIHCFYNPFDKYTKYEMAKLGSKILNKNINHIQPLNDKPLYQTALRPRDTQLFDKEINNKLLNHDIKITLLENGLKKVLNKFIHPNLNSINNDVFYLLDLDGTLVDSEKVQWKAYRDALKEYNIEYNFEKFTRICHDGNIKKYLIENHNFSEDMYFEMKKKKKEHMKKYKNEIKLIVGVSKFIDIIEEKKINHVVVTNSSVNTVNLYKEVIPKLNKLKNWIKREDYKLAKPSGECYKKAINDFYKNEKYIIGFENSLSGLESLKCVTNIIYFVTYKDYLFYNIVKKEDVFLINDFNDI